MTKKRNKIFLYCALISLFTAFFVYLNFPYQILYQNIYKRFVIELRTANIPMKITIDNLESYKGLGFKISNMRIWSAAEPGKSFAFDKITISPSLFPMLAGTVTFHVEMFEKTGMIDSTYSFSLFSLLSGQPKLESAQGNFENYSIDGVLDVFLSLLRYKNPVEFAFVLPVLEKTSIGGKLNGSFAYKENESAQGSIYFNQGFIDLNNESLSIPRQNFSVAEFRFEWQPGRMSIEDGTQFKSQNLSLIAGGTIENTKTTQETPTINLKLKINLSGQIERTLSFLLPDFLNCPNKKFYNGSLSVNLFGKADSFSCR